MWRVGSEVVGQWRSQKFSKGVPKRSKMCVSLSSFFYSSFPFIAANGEGRGDGGSRTQLTCVIGALIISDANQ